MITVSRPAMGSRVEHFRQSLPRTSSGMKKCTATVLEYGVGARSFSFRWLWLARTRAVPYCFFRVNRWTDKIMLSSDKLIEITAERSAAHHVTKVQVLAGGGFFLARRPPSLFLIVASFFEIQRGEIRRFWRTANSRKRRCEWNTESFQLSDTGQTRVELGEGH